jgi:hypothetical protein
MSWERYQPCSYRADDLAGLVDHSNRLCKSGHVYTEAKGKSRRKIEGKRCMQLLREKYRMGIPEKGSLRGVYSVYIPPKDEEIELSV